MSEQTIGTNTASQLVVNTDTSKIFIWGNRYMKANFNNSQYDPLVMKAGTVLGRNPGTGQYVFISDSTVNDGTEIPVGILANDVTIEDGDVAEVSVCIGGDIADDKVILHGSDTLDTLVASQNQIYRDLIQKLGIRLIPSTEMTGNDND